MNNVFLIALIYIIPSLYSPALAETPPLEPDSTNLNQIAKSILAKEIELERLNTQFRIETTLVSPWRQRRMFAYGESNASLTEASLITSLLVRFNLARKKIPKPPPDQKDRSRLAAAARTQLVGQAIGAGGDIFELGLNFTHYCSTRKKNLNPASYSKRVRNLHVELDNLINQYFLLLDGNNDLSSDDIVIAQAEGKLLSDSRDLILLEYSQYLSGTKRFWRQQNTAYLVDFAKNATGMAGNLVTLESIHAHRPRWSGAAFLLSTISGTIVLITPVVGRVTGNIAGLAAEKTASKELNNIQATHAQSYLSDKDKLNALIEQKPMSTAYLAAVRNRQQLYEHQEELFLSQRDFLRRQRKNARDTLIENIIFAGVVGPPRVANGILGMVGNWHYYNNSPDRNRLIAAGNTAYLAGNTFNVLETARVQASIEWHNKELAKNHLLPRQQFQHRLQRLNDMDQILTR